MLHPHAYRADCERRFGKLALPDYSRKGAILPSGSKFTHMDLVDAMKRQLKFMRKICDLKAFSDKSYLEQAVDRYDRFLRLIKLGRGIIVPTLDIDIVWHTHQLHPGHYSKDTMDLLGFTPDHDDDMNEQHLEIRREKSEMMWTEQYGE